MLLPETICYGNEQLQVKAGAYQGEKDFDAFQLGGHIHLGFDINIDKDTFAQYLSFFCGIPLTLITDTEKKYTIDNISERDVRHNKGQYGQYGGYREKDYGVEFRMPSSWLVSPQVTIGVLSLAYVVGYEFIAKSPNEQHIWNDIFKEKYRVYPGNYIDLYKRQSWDIIQDYFTNIKLEIQQMELYPIYKEYIDYILDMIDRKQTWHSERNILPLWAEMW